MADRRQKDVQWQVANEHGEVRTWEQASVAVLMDIRDELKQLNRILGCINFLQLPRLVSQIESNTRRKAKPAKKKAAA